MANVVNDGLLTRYKSYCVDHWGYKQLSPEEKSVLFWPVRFKPAVTMILAVVALLLHASWLLVTLGVLGLIGTFIPSMSWIDRWWNHILAPLFGKALVSSDPSPRRFACGMADGFLLVAGIAWLLGYSTLTYWLAGAVIGLAGSVVLSGYCVVADAYRIIVR